MTNPAVPSVTLSEILQFALPSGSQVLTGADYLDRRVHWARLLRARPAGAVEPGELLILPPGLAESLGEPRVVARLVTELIDAGVTAFVASGPRLEAIVDACALRDTPLLLVPAETALADVERSIVGLVLDRDAQLRRRAEEVYGRLLATMLGNAGLAALVEAMEEATGLRVAVFDDALSLQALAPEDDEFKHAVQAKAGAILIRETEAGITRLNRPLQLAFESGNRAWTGHLYPLQIGAAWAGYLALIGQPGQPGEIDRLLADRATTLVALELAKRRAVAEATQRWRGEFLDDVVQANYPSEEAIVARGRQLGYDLLSPHLALVLAADPDTNRLSRVDGQAAVARQRRRFVDVARGVVLREEPGALVVEREGALVALIPASGSAEVETVTTVVERMRSSAAEALPGIGISAGVGQLVGSPAEFQTAHHEATQALAIGQKLLGGARTTHYGQLGVERLLLHLVDNPELERFANDVLGDLLAYDALHRGELVRTLEVFLRCNGNHVRAAQELHLHRNTLLYRLDRAREILGRDMDDADTRLSLQVALRVKGVAIQPLVGSVRATQHSGSRRKKAG